MLQCLILQSLHLRSNPSNLQHHKITVYIYTVYTPALTQLFIYSGSLTTAFIFLRQVNLTEMLWYWSMDFAFYDTTVCLVQFFLYNRLPVTHIQKKQCVFTRTHLHPNLCNLQASYSGVTVPSFHSIRISPRCKVGEECGRRMACSVSGALSLGTGDPGMLTSGLGV